MGRIQKNKGTKSNPPSLRVVKSEWHLIPSNFSYFSLPGEEVQNTPGAQTETIKDKLAVIIKGWEVLGDKWDERAHLLNQCRYKLGF